MRRRRNLGSRCRRSDRFQFGLGFRNRGRSGGGSWGRRFLTRRSLCFLGGNGRYRDIDQLFRFDPSWWRSGGFGGSRSHLDPFCDPFTNGFGLLGFERAQLILDVVTKLLAVIKDDLVINFQTFSEDIDSRFVGCLICACGQAMLLRRVLETPITH